MLTRTQIDAVKPRLKPYKLADGRGLYLEVSPVGGRWWRFRYRLGGKEKRVSLGVYPDIGLKEARERLDQARKTLASGVDPAQERRASKVVGVIAANSTFEAVGRDWFKRKASAWVDSHSDKIIGRLERDVFPWIGSRPINAVTAPELLLVLRRIESRGAIDTAHRALQNCGQIFRYAISTSRAVRDISADLRGAPAPIITQHYAAVKEPKAVGSLMRAIGGYQGSFVTKSALRLAPLTFVRPGELRNAEWGGGMFRNR